MTALCRHPGCIAVLASGNLSGLCRAHLHGPVCACPRCAVPPSGRLSDADRRRLSAARSLSAATDHPDRIQPAFDLTPTPLKGHP